MPPRSFRSSRCLRCMERVPGRAKTWYIHPNNWAVIVFEVDKSDSMPRFYVAICFKCPCSRTSTVSRTCPTRPSYWPRSILPFCSTCCPTKGPSSFDDQKCSGRLRLFRIYYACFTFSRGSSPCLVSFDSRPKDQHGMERPRGEARQRCIQLHSCARVISHCLGESVELALRSWGI